MVYHIDIKGTKKQETLYDIRNNLQGVFYFIYIYIFFFFFGFYPHISGFLHGVFFFIYIYFFFFFLLFSATSVAYGGSQARDLIRAVAPCLHHNSWH